MPYDNSVDIGKAFVSPDGEIVSKEESREFADRLLCTADKSRCQEYLQKLETLGLKPKTRGFSNTYISVEFADLETLLDEGKLKLKRGSEVLLEYSFRTRIWFKLDEKGAKEEPARVFSPLTLFPDRAYNKSNISLHVEVGKERGWAVPSYSKANLDKLIKAVFAHSAKSVQHAYLRKWDSPISSEEKE